MITNEIRYRRTAECRQSPLSSTRSPTRARKAPTTPFCTIPSRTSAWWPFPTGASISSPRCTTQEEDPAVIEFVDIAGLVKGANQVRGLGNSSLRTSAARTPSCVVRCFDDENIMHVVADARHERPRRPLGDKDIDLELIMADLEMVNRRVERRRRWPRATRSSCTRSSSSLLLPSTSTRAKSARPFEVSSDDAELIATADLLSLKPIIYAANMDEDGFANQDGNQYLQQVKELADREARRCCRSAPSSSRTSPSSTARAARCSSRARHSGAGLDRLIKCSYALLGLISFLTYGEDECRAWTIKNGTKAPQAAGQIHSPTSSAASSARNVNFDDMIRCGSVAAAKEKGFAQRGQESTSSRTAT